MLRYGLENFDQNRSHQSIIEQKQISFQTREELAAVHDTRQVKKKFSSRHKNFFHCKGIDILILVIYMSSQD